MPFYEFQCKNCNFEDILFVSISESDKILNCPKCGGGEFRKVLSPGSFILRTGVGGFHSKDYKK